MWKLFLKENYTKLKHIVWKEVCRCFNQRSGQPNGVAPLDEDGQIPAEFLENGGGGGAVVSVNGDTGTVVLTQDDILAGASFSQFSSGEKTKLAGISANATQAALDTLGRATAYAQTSGTNTYTATISPAPTAYTLGDSYIIRIMSANTATPSINLNGLGAKPIVKNGSQGIIAGELRAGQIYRFTYDGNNFQVTGHTTVFSDRILTGTPASAAATGTIWDIRADADYIYVCTATNTWKRAALTTW